MYRSVEVYKSVETRERLTGGYQVVSLMPLENYESGHISIGRPTVSGLHPIVYMVQSRIFKLGHHRNQLS